MQSAILFLQQAPGGRGSIHHARSEGVSTLAEAAPRAWWMLPLPPRSLWLRRN